MNGLLGIDDPRTMGLLSLGLRLMSSPGKLGPALGQAGMGALGDVQGVVQANRQRERQTAADKLAQERFQMERDRFNALREAEQRRAGYLSSVSGQMGPPEPVNPASALSAGLSPQEMAMLMPQAKGRRIEKVGNSLVEVPDSGPVNPLFTEAPKPDEFSSALIAAGIMPGSPEFIKLMRARAEKMATHQPGVSVSYGAPTAGIDPQGNPVFMQPTKDGSPPLIVPGIRPPKSAAEERADQERSTKQKQGQQMLSVMSDAEAILKAGRATASGIGTIADAAARVGGVTTKGAQEAARLQALSGWLVANVPRMEGPQSNYDVQNYMLMAGKIGDSTVPIPERLAALDTVRKLQIKYAEINGTPVQSPSQPAKKVVRTGTLNGRKVVQYEDGSTAYAD